MTTLAADTTDALLHESEKHSYNSGTEGVVSSINNRVWQLTGVSDGIITVEDQQPSSEVTEPSKVRAHKMEVVFSIGGLFTVGLSLLAVLSFAGFAIGLYAKIFVPPGLALFLGLCFSALAGEAIYSRQFIRGGENIDEESR